MSSKAVPRSEPPDAMVRRRVVENVSESFIVQAPAGSGKTELLAQRFLALLATVEQPESVLAITFTRKAASEMRIRILKALESASVPLKESASAHEVLRRELALKVLEADRLHGWRLLENPLRLQVRTVDSLSESIARQLPMRAGMAQDLDITDDASELYREAADRVIAELGQEGRESEAVATMLRYMDNNVGRLRELLVSMLARRDQWLRVIAGANRLNDHELQEKRRQLELALRRSIENELSTTRVLLCDALGSSKAELARLLQVRLGSGVSRAELPRPTVEHLEEWRTVADLLTTKDGGFRRRTYECDVKLADREDRDSCAKILEGLVGHSQANAICTALSHLRNLPSPRYTDDEWGFVHALLIALPRSVAALSVVFSDQGLVDFIEMSQAARHALLTEDGPTELGLSIGSQMQHLLMDEFQDTSWSQLELIHALTQGWEENGANTMFLVGDPMQSIYSFREAEVTIFTRTFGGTPTTARDLKWRLKAERLEANFRSQAGLVSFFNDVHSQILTRDDDAIAAVKYWPAKAIKEAHPDPVIVRGFGPKDHLAEALWIGECVEGELAGSADSKIAILVRSRAHLLQVVRNLESRHIKFRAVDIDSLAKRQVVLDLDALARAICDPADRQAWLSVLRSPVSGLKLADLWELCRGDRDSTIPKLLYDRLVRLSPDGKLRAENVLKALERASRDLATTPLHLVVERAWTSLGGWSAVDPEDRDAELREAEVYFDFLEASGPDLRPGSTRYRAKLEKLYAPPAPDPQIRVEVMTIHGAKGLEWDVVFLPALSRTPRSSEQQLLHWLERGEENELLLGPMRSIREQEPDRTIQKYLQRLELERGREELKRLLYVATTRAKKRLYLSAALGKNGPSTRSMLHLLWNVESLRGEFEQSGEVTPGASSGAALGEQRLRRFASVFEPPSVAQTLTETIDEAFVEELHTYDWAGETRRRIGTVTHAFLEVIAQQGLDEWTHARIEASRGAIRSALISEGVGPQRVDAAVADVIKALNNTIADERGRWILAAKDEAQSEYVITSRENGEPKVRRIDRKFVDGGIVWIIDYKTTDIEGGDRESFLAEQVEKYREDIARYAAAVRRLEIQHSARPREVRCALYFPLQQEFRPVPID